MKAALTGENSIVLDARTQDAYSGWSTETNKIGGHIEGAVGFSASWLTCAYNDSKNNDNRTRAERLAICMKNKGITANTKVIIYDENGKDAKAIANYLYSKGVKSIKLFNLAKWTEGTESYKNYSMVLPPSVVKKLIDGETVAEVGAVSDLKVIEFSWGTEEQSGYLKGHVPTAIHVNSDDVDDEDNIYVLDKDEILFETAKNAGITKDSTVVVTGDGLFACHFATILKYLGVEKVYIMSGGASGWTDAGYTAEKTANYATPVADFGATTPLNPDYIDTADEAEDILADSNAQLIDTRAYKEFTGATSGYGYVKEAGRPEGAIFGQLDGSDQGAKCNGSSMMYYENIDGTMRDGAEILDMWKNSNVDVDKHLSFYCGGGYRAAAVMWYAQCMGLTNTSLYNDGWSGWIVYGKAAVKGTYEKPEPVTYSKAQVWLPMPSSDDNQTIENEKWSVPGATTVEEKTTAEGSKILYIEWDNTVAPTARKATVSFDFERKAMKAVDISGSTADTAVGMEKYLGEFATSGSFESGIVRETADAIVERAEATTLAEKALAIYEWEVANLFRLDNVYDGCGQGKVTEILNKWKTGERAGGHCTDLNSVYVALCRAAGVPAREMFGLRANEDATGGQHCRAQFYLPDVDGGSWIEADPADTLKMIKGTELEEKKASKDEEVAGAALQSIFDTYKPKYWTANDENWVLFNMDRDLMLSPEQNGKGGCAILNTDGTLNNFGYPYAEIDGISGYTYQANKFVYTYKTTNINKVDGESKSGTITCTLDLSAGNVVK